MPQRNRYDLSHYSFMSGKIGRLMTLSAIPVVAGDSMSINAAGAFRLSPLRRDLALDAMIDLFAFYVPHRHVYGDTWIDFLKLGADENITFPGTGVNADVVCQYLGYNRLDNSMPLWLPAGYNMIWNRYFRVPNSSVAELPVTGSGIIPGDSESRNYGIGTARLKTFPTTGHNAPDVSAANLTFTLPPPGAGTGGAAQSLGVDSA